MKIRYITIEREYGSGGNQIARETAVRCGIGCYGREIMNLVAEQEHCSIRQLEQYEERVSGSLLYSMFVMSQSQTGDPDLLSPEAKLYVAEGRIIQHLAKTGPAVFVGHCAAKALEKEQGVLRVYIRGSEEEKQKRIIEQYGIEPRDVAATSRSFNRRRANYYHFCTRTRWEDPRNYDLILDSSALGIAGCVDVLCTLYEGN